jgi:hypothetical protein
MARKSKKGRKLGLFIGGAIYSLVRGIFFDNKYVRRRKRRF